MYGQQNNNTGFYVPPAGGAAPPPPAHMGMPPMGGACPPPMGGACPPPMGGAHGIMPLPGQLPGGMMPPMHQGGHNQPPHHGGHHGVHHGGHHQHHRPGGMMGGSSSESVIEYALFDNSSDGVRMTTCTVPMTKQECMSYNNSLFAGHEAFQQMPNQYAVVECKMDPTKDSGNVANCLFEGANSLQEGSNHIRFFQFPGCQGGASYGLSHQGIYAPGWGMRGALLNPAGNLASNSLIKGNYSRGHGPNQIVDMICEVSQGIVNVYFYVNGQNFGHAYCLDFRHAPQMIQNLKPVVQFSDTACGSRVMVAMHPTMPLGHGNAPWRNLPVQPAPGNPCA